ncbi:MAG: AAA family ATPase [Planctomycetaceae bacterium]
MGAPDISIKLENFKCFGEEPQGFETFKPFNLIIGRNNSGKSSLLDVFEYLVQNQNTIDAKHHHHGHPSKILATSRIDENIAKKVWHEYTESQQYLGTVETFVDRIKGAEVLWTLNGSHSDFREFTASFRETHPFVNFNDTIVGKAGLLQVKQRIAASMCNPFTGKYFCRISAERDIAPEKRERSYKIQPSGTGVTNILHGFLSNSKLQIQLGLRHDFIETDFLTVLNNLMHPDAVFTAIDDQENDNDEWEIYLREESKGLVPLSQSGSGLKTLIIVLANIILLPKLHKRNLSDYIFGFEELENNLHPAILRRLLDFLFNLAINNGPTMLLTTHSNVAIDFFSKSTDAQIIHVTHDGKTASCRTVTTYVHNKGILDDLDVRASDLLQSNGVIWVEGPSDRIYLNRWIELFDEELKEELHYQIVYYGGKILYHFSADAPGDCEKCEIFKNNRNAYIVIDSDIKTEGGEINTTKQRIAHEIKSNDGTAWVTMGKEIENYLPAASVAKAFGKESVPQIDKFEKFADYVEELQGDGEDSSIDKKKVSFAEKVVPFLKDDSVFEVMDLRDRIRELCSKIRSWNRLPGKSY